MSGGTKVINLWQDQNAETDEHLSEQGAVDTQNFTVETNEVPDFSEFEEAPKSSKPSFLIILASLALAGLALGWIGLVFASNRSILAGKYINPEQCVSLIGTLAPPLVLIALLALFLRQSATKTQLGSTQMIERLRQEKDMLSRFIVQTEVKLAHSLHEISAHGEQLDAVGEATLNRITTLRAMLSEEIGQISLHTNGLKNAAAAARSDMAVLMANLPKAHVETRKIVNALTDAGITALEQTQRLGVQVNQLSEHSRDAKSEAGAAAETLAQNMNAMAAQITDMRNTVEQAQKTLSEVGSESQQNLELQIAEASRQIDALGKELQAQDGLSEKLCGNLRATLTDVEGRLAAIDTHGVERTEILSEAIKSLTKHSQTLRDDLELGGNSAEKLIAKSEALIVSLEASAHEIDNVLPAAFARLEQTALASQAQLTESVTKAEQLETRVAATHNTLSDSQNVLAESEARATSTHERLVESHTAAQALNAELAKCEADALAIANGATTTLVEAMLRVRETAQQAGERAKETIQGIIPDSMAAIGTASQAAVREAIQGQIETEIARVSEVAQEAVLAAGMATDKLMQQMLTVSETSAAFNAQIKETRENHEENVQTSLSKRVSQLIESLNSISIDVTKILSNEVTDAAWAAYLKGDRGIFTRRAVKLINGGETREIIRHYDSDAEFREHVNHYIHNFEAMLRTVLSTRESGPLSVTLLSSDMGKLYVALAQAIERLRA